MPVIRALLAGVGKTAGRVYPSQELHHQSSIFTGAAGLCAADLVSDVSSAKAAAAAATSLLTLSEEVRGVDLPLASRLPFFPPA